MAVKRDYYEVLGVERDVSEAELKSAFRRLARDVHPDVNADDPQAEEKFKEAAEAYEVLSDPERRRTYDALGHEGLRSGGWAPRTAGFGGIQDIFEAFFGGDPFGASRRGPAPGGDVLVTMDVELAGVLEAQTRNVTFEAVSVCETCRGNGAKPGTPIKTCEQCEGTGQLRQVTQSVFGQVVQATPCDRCGGDGRIAETPCEACDGDGRVADTRTWEVDVPAGIEDGQRIRIAGGGHAGEAGGRQGDLYVEVQVIGDEHFARQGTELVGRVKVPVTVAMLGGEVEVPTLDGDRTIEVPTGAQHGDVSVLEGEGLPPLHGGRRGDLHMIFELEVPTELTGEQRDAAEQLADKLGQRATARPS